MDELVRLVAQKAGIPTAQAALAVSATLDYLTARLPSPLAGRIRAHLVAIPSFSQADIGDRGFQ